MDDLAWVAIGGHEWASVRAEFVEAQAGQCAICFVDITDAPQLDHCHVTGFVRGVLCVGCNTRLGWYEGKRKVIEAYLSQACQYAAGAAPRLPSIPRPPKPKRGNAERWRKHWQDKHLD